MTTNCTVCLVVQSPGSSYSNSSFLWAVLVPSRQMAEYTIQLSHNRSFIIPSSSPQSITSFNYMLNNHKSLYTITEACTITSAYKNCRPEENLFVCNIFSNGISRLHYILLIFLFFPLPMAQQPLVGQDLLTIQV
jgi:hypothetical protein